MLSLSQSSLKYHHHFSFSHEPQKRISTTMGAGRFRGLDCISSSHYLCNHSIKLNVNKLLTRLRFLVGCFIKSKKSMIQKIKYARKRKRLTQIELSIKLGISPTSVGNWEGNRTTMPAEIVPLLCKELEISPNELFGWEK